MTKSAPGPSDWTCTGSECAGMATRRRTMITRLGKLAVISRPSSSMRKESGVSGIEDSKRTSAPLHCASSRRSGEVPRTTLRIACRNGGEPSYSVRKELAWICT